MHINRQTYAHRNSLLSQLRSYRIEDDALYWQDDHQPEVRLAYADINSVEAQFSPTRVQANRYLLRLKTRSKGNVDITNTSYKGIGDFEELNETYVPFVIELHKKSAAKNPAISFKKGSSWAGYIFAIVVAVALIALIAGAGVFFLVSGMIWIAAIKLAILIFLFPRLIRYIKRNKPASYNPLMLPDHALPVI